MKEDKMKAYKVTLSIIDFDNVGEDGIKDVIEMQKYPNRCISPKVIDVESAELGEWHDDHPLNKMGGQREFWSKNV